MYELASCLGELGHSVTILAGEVAAGAVDRVPFTLRRMRSIGLTQAGRWQSFERAITEHMARHDYDIVHSAEPMLPANVYQPGVGPVSAKEGGCCGLGERGFLRRLTGWAWALGTAQKIRSERERRLCAVRNGPVVAAVSEYAAERFRKDHGLDETRLRVVRTGANVEEIRTERARERGRKLRRLYDRNGDLALLLFAAEDMGRAGLTPLLQAAAEALRLRATERDFRILVLSGETCEKYWPMAQDLGLGQRVLFVGPTGETAAMLQMADAVVLPTVDGGCSRVILEGLAAGKPAITTRCNGAAEFLGQGKYGLVINDARDTAALAATLLKICDRSEQERMSQAIEEDRLYEQVSMRRRACELLTLYQEIR